jgi:hypothetical protein
MASPLAFTITVKGKEGISLTTMVPIDNEIAAIKLLEPGEHYSYCEVACRFTMLYTTLTQRHKGC